MELQAKRKPETKVLKKNPSPSREPTPTVLKKSVFDTTKYYYYYTEIQKDRP